MAKKNLKKLWGSGTLKIFDVEIDAYVLEDGTTLIGRSKIIEALKMTQGGDRSKSKDGGYPRFIGAKNLHPFVREELAEQLEGIEFIAGNKNASAYSSDILTSICNVYLEAREAGVLTHNQLPIAQQCEILIRSFAKVGLKALIYEQLGFEKMKHPDAYRMLIESYLSEEIRKWSKEFPDELFVQMDRIYGNERTTSRNRPMYYAKFIRKYVYQPIQHGEVLKGLDDKIPKDSKGRKTKRLHQATSEEIGLPALRAQIWQVVGVLKSSSNKRVFESNYARLMGQNYQTDLFDKDEV